MNNSLETVLNSVLDISFWLTLILGVLALVAAIIGAAIGVIRLWAYLFEAYLVARKLREIFREFMVRYVRSQNAAERRSRK